MDGEFTSPLSIVIRRGVGWQAVLVIGSAAIVRRVVWARRNAPVIQRKGRRAVLGEPFNPSVEVKGESGIDEVGIQSWVPDPDISIRKVTKAVAEAELCVRAEFDLDTRAEFSEELEMGPLRRKHAIIEIENAATTE
jgi:hypothetical protein